MVTIQKVINALKQITNVDLVVSGIVRNIQIEEGKVSCEVALKNQDVSLIKKIEETLSNLQGVSKVEIKLPLQTTKQAQTPIEQMALKNIKNIIAISSCKGGVGKSTIAAHLAQDLVRRGFKVGLIDADIYGPSIPTLFNIHDAVIKANDKNQLIPIEKNGLKIMSFGFLLGDNVAILRGPIVTRYVQQILLGTAWGELDYLLLDLPPGTGDVHLTITQTIRLSGAVIVTTPHTLSLIDVARGILMFERVSVPILGVIENMSYFQPENSAEKHYLFGQQGSQKLKEKFGVKILAEIPILTQLTGHVEQNKSNEFITNATKAMLEELIKVNELKNSLPTIEFDEQKISVIWPDGTKNVVSNFDLRLNSQDALSVNELTGEKIIKAENIRKDIAAKKIMPLGNYAIGIDWNDGHSAGIYPYQLIKELAQK